MTPDRWIEAGGLALFAFSVWVEVRGIRKTLADLRGDLTNYLFHRGNR